MERYVGLDGHSRSCTFGVISASGRHLQSLVVETNGKALVESVRLIPGRVHLCLEEGTQSAWLYELLKPHVSEIVVSMPAKASGGAKDDKRDAFARAEELRVDSIETRVYKAPEHLAALRTAVRAYSFAVQRRGADQEPFEGSVPWARHQRGCQCVRPGAAGQVAREVTSPYRQLAEMLGQQLEELMPVREEAERWLLKESKTHPIIRKLATAPGMGPIRTAQVVAIVATPERFRKRQQFWSYCGLGIATRSSSDWRPGKTGNLERVQSRSTRGLTRKRHPLLKAVFKGAATTVITQLPDNPLHAHYQRMLQKGIKPALARLTLARQIAATVLSMWKHQEVYDPKRNTLAEEP